MLLTQEACSIRKYIPEKSHLLDKVKIKGEPSQYSSDLYNLQQQKPNKKILGVWKINMWFYLLAREGKILKKKEEKLKKDLWEEPVLLDSTKLNATLEQMQAYMFNKGYFHAKASYEVKYSAHKAKVTYKIEPGPVFTINKIDYKIADTRIARLIYFDKNNSLIHTGSNFDGDILSQERDRITLTLRNNGYYNFSREYIYYDIDSTLPGNVVNVGFGIANPPNSQRHRLYKINNISIEPEYRLGDKSTKERDTMGDFIFVGNHKRLKPRILSDFVFFQRGNLYNARDYQSTLNRLSQLGLYQFIDIQYQSDTLNRPDTALLNVFIRLTPQPKQEATVELELNTTEESQVQLTNISSRTLGIASNFVYRNKNIAHSALQLEVRPRISVELPSRILQDVRVLDTPIYEYGVNTALSFPQLLLPFKIKDKTLRLSSQSVLNFNVFFEENQYYDRKTINTNLTYQITGQKFRHFITPVEVSLVNTGFQSRAFEDTIRKINDPLLLNLFDQHIIADARYSILYNRQPLTLVKKRYWVFRNTIESGGNLAAGVDRLFNNQEKKDSSLTRKLFGIKYFQYLKNETDVRLYLPIWRENNLALRTIIGLGAPYGNSDVLPFEKRFFCRWFE